MSANVRWINPPTLAQPPGYTQVVEAQGGRTLYISGQVALDAEGNLVGPGDVQAQMRQVFENLKAALAAAGADFSHVVKLTYFVADFSQLEGLRDIRDDYVNTDHPPASTAVQVVRLFREDLLIEVEAVAVV